MQVESPATDGHGGPGSGDGVEQVERLVQLGGKLFDGIYASLNHHPSKTVTEEDNNEEEVKELADVKVEYTKCFQRIRELINDGDAGVSSETIEKAPEDLLARREELVRDVKKRKETIKFYLDRLQELKLHMSMLE